MIEKGSLSEVEKRLGDPFTMRQIARVDELVIYAYACFGSVAWHRHLDYDELFLIYRGDMVLETQWGSVMLGPWDCAVAPKSLGHRSASMRPATVLLIQAGVMPDRQNGDRKAVASPDGTIERLSLSVEARRLREPYAPKPLVRVDRLQFSVMFCRGEGAGYQTPGEEWLLVHSGALELRAGDETVSLGSGEFVVIPAGVPRQIIGRQAAFVAMLRRPEG